MAGGTPVEIAVSSVSPNTVRITLQPIASGQPAAIPEDGVLAQAEWGKSLARARTGATLANVKAGNLVVKVAASPLVITVEGSDMRTVQEFKFDAAAPGFSFLLPRGPLLGLGEGGSQYDRKGATDRMPSGQATLHAEHTARLSPRDARRSRADPVDGGHRRLGPLHPSAPRRVRFHRRHGQVHAARRSQRDRSLRRLLEGSRGDHARLRAHHGSAGNAGAVDARLPAIASHARWARRSEVGREDDAREEAAVRRADLSRHGLHAVRLEHAQRRVHVEREKLPRSESDDRRAPRASTSRSCCTSSSRPAPRPGQER